MWAQYNLGDPMPAIVQATTSLPVDPASLAAAGRGQIEMPSDMQPPCTVDMTTDPPVFSPMG